MALELAHDAYGEAGPPLVVLHGLLGAARNWTGIGRQLGESFRGFALDLRNHGRSPWAATMTFDEMAGDVALLIERQGLAPVTVIGHSLGGKVAMRLALLRPELVRRLVVVDVAPAAYSHTFGPFVEAMQQVDLAAVRRRSDAERQLESTIGDAVVRNFLLQNLIKTESGFAWRVNLAALAANMPELLGFPLPEVGVTYGGSTLFIAGARSHYIGAEHRPVIERLFPKARHSVIAGAGHWVHAERPAEFLDELRGFLDEP
jgi:esterase